MLKKTNTIVQPIAKRSLMPKGTDPGWIRYSFMGDLNRHI